MRGFCLRTRILELLKYEEGPHMRALFFVPANFPAVTSTSNPIRMMRAGTCFAKLMS